MNINELLVQKKMTKYKLAKNSDVPQTTVIDICSGKTRIEKCSAHTLYKLAKTLDVTMESLVSDAMKYRPSFETFKSNVCHMVKDIGELDFVIHTLESDEIRELYQKQRFPECLYMLAMLDYLCRENGLPVCAEYNDIRKMRLSETIYPAGIVTLCTALKNDEAMTKSRADAIPEFMRFNIVESEVRNVY